MGRSDAFSRRRFVGAVGGIAASPLLAGCSSGGGGCSEPKTDATPESLLPEEGNGFEQLSASEAQLQEKGDARIQGRYADEDVSYTVFIFRFREQAGATEYEQSLVDAAEMQNTSVYAAFALGNFVFGALVEASDLTRDETLGRVEELLGGSSTLSAGCVADKNALDDDTLPPTE